MSIEICSDHNGKMEGMQSISTSCKDNPCCVRNHTIKGSICEHCYAHAMLDMYSALHSKCERNTEALTKKLLSPSEIPHTTCDVFRFEAFGDIYNETHLKNYIAIAKANPQTRFTLWSKNYPVVLHYFKTNKCPDNFTMIISSLFVNKKTDLTPFKATGAFKPGQLKVFTVYDYGFIKNDPTAVKINCGSKLCRGCMICYNKNTVEEVNEVLKSDQSKVDAILRRISPTYESEGVELADELDELDL